MAVYRANVLKIEPTADGSLHADVSVDLRIAGDPVSWKQVSSGHFTVVIDAKAVLAITDGAGTNSEKKKALQDLIKIDALDRGVDVADMAYAEWIKLMPEKDYPLEITIRN